MNLNIKVRNQYGDFISVPENCFIQVSYKGSDYTNIDINYHVLKKLYPIEGDMYNRINHIPFNSIAYVNHNAMVFNIFTHQNFMNMLEKSKFNLYNHLESYTFLKSNPKSIPYYEIVSLYQETKYTGKYTKKLKYNNIYFNCILLYSFFAFGLPVAYAKQVANKYNNLDEREIDALFLTTDLDKKMADMYLRHIEDGVKSIIKNLNIEDKVNSTIIYN